MANPAKSLYWASSLAVGAMLGLGAYRQGPAVPPPAPPAVAAPLQTQAAAQVLVDPRSIRRDDMIRAAEQMAAHRWTCREANVFASCLRGFDYRADWRAEESVTGVAYDWGGDDDASLFDAKLRQGYAAGSHSRHGVSSCTAGIDCSGFVQYCWGLRGRPYSTWTLHRISQDVPLNPFKDLLPGDALNKASSHIVLFAGYRPDGNPIVYEATGGAGRVIRNAESTWARYRGYHPLRYRYVTD